MYEDDRATAGDAWETVVREHDAATGPNPKYDTGHVREGRAICDGIDPFPDESTPPRAADPRV